MSTLSVDTGLSPGNDRPRRQRAKRTGNACIPCRQSKIKCSGTEPCSNCQRRFAKCRFAPPPPKTKRSPPSGLHPLAALSDTGGPPPTLRNIDPRLRDANLSSGSVVPRLRPDAPSDSHSSQRFGHNLNVWTSPFSLPSATVKNTFKNKRRWIWLAPSSNWSFTVRLTIIITEKLGLEPPFSKPNFTDRDIYPLKWEHHPVNEPPDLSGLPSMDHALYLFNTVKFHLGQNYRFFDEEEFVKYVHDFYRGNALQMATNSRLWFVQFLMVLSFGKAFLWQSKSSKDPPGADFFVRAMSLLPEIGDLWKDSILAAEVLALIALYLYSIDKRESAHVYVNQAIGIAQLEGLHTELPEYELGAATVDRCRNLWWTLYIIERQFTSSIGLPMTIHDEEISALSPSTDIPGHETTTLGLQVKLSRMLMYILSTVYRSEKTQLGAFLETTRSIMHTMAGHALEIEKIIQMKFQDSLDTMPKGTRHITLLYHQCVITATRPLLLSILRERLDKLGQNDDDWESYLAATTKLISTGIKSATKTLQILSYEDSLLEIFLPFDFEFAYTAAVYLTMATTLFPCISDGKSYLQLAHTILDEMIQKGNRVVEARKQELEYVEGLFNTLARQVEWKDLQTLTLPAEAPPPPRPPPMDPQMNQEITVFMSDDPGTVSGISSADTGDHPLPLHDQQPAEYLDNIGISSDDFFSIVDEIENQELFYYDPMAPGEEWNGEIAVSMEGAT